MLLPSESWPTATPQQTPTPRDAVKAIREALRDVIASRAALIAVYEAQGLAPALVATMQERLVYERAMLAVLETLRADEP